MIQLPDRIQNIKEKITPSQRCFLVGGAIRDMIISREINDFDIACSFDPKALARSMAKENNGNFFVLDATRKTYRVIEFLSDKSKIIYDFTQIQGDTILSDLLARDFTINAMAIDIVYPSQIIDPSNGQKDLEQRILRICSPESFLSDPVRVIRAVRYTVSLQLQIEPKTEILLFNSGDGLSKVSTERKRDELFKIYEQSSSEKALDLLWKYGIFKNLGFGTSTDIEKSLVRVKKFELLIEYLKNHNLDAPEEYPNIGDIDNAIGEFRNEMDLYMFDPISSDRKRLVLDKFILSFWRNPETIQLISTCLALSNDEKEHIQRIIQNQNAFSELISKPKIERLDVYYFYKSLANSGLDLLMFELTELFSSEINTRQHENIKPSLIAINKLIRYWYREPEIVNPTPILNGEEIKNIINEPPGPKIGLLIENLKEEQVKGNIRSKQEASEYILKRNK